MKSFKELSENITEEEYRNNGRFHYSDIAGYMREGFSYLVKPHKEESESLTFGSMVDCIVTQGMDEFNNKYCVAKEFNLSDNQKAVISNLVNETQYERLEDIPSDIIIGSLSMFYKNPKTQLSKLFEDGSEYYRFLYENQGKIPVDFQMFQDAIDVANVLLTNTMTQQFFGDSTNGVDRFYQLKFNGDFDGIPITAMVDALYIEHATKRVFPIDLKTTCANYEWEFPKSFLKYSYHVQARLYSYILRQIMDKDDFYKDYTLEGFVFIYVSRQNKTPLIWTFEDNLTRGDMEIKTKNDNKIILKDFIVPLTEMHCIKECGYTMPLDVKMTGPNDVINHLMEF